MIANLLRWWLARFLWAWQLRLGGGHGRHVDWMPVECLECGWRGPERWLRHGYENDGTGEDVEPVDYCPRCGSDHVEEEYL
jgi:predicted Zn-ribbon and HTH transcriptional regulator